MSLTCQRPGGPSPSHSAIPLEKMPRTSQTCVCGVGGKDVDARHVARERDCVASPPVDFRRDKHLADAPDLLRIHLGLDCCPYVARAPITQDLTAIAMWTAPPWVLLRGIKVVTPDDASKEPGAAQCAWQSANGRGRSAHAQGAARRRPAAARSASHRPIGSCVDC
jgi:hypothetical protein